MEQKFEVGAKVETDRGKGEVAYFGETQFADGIWVGIILNEPKGLNNGTVKGVEYFHCENKYGIFFRPSQVKLETKSRMQPPSGLRMPSTSSRTDLAAMKKKSTSSTPSMTPSSSTEKLRSMESISSVNGLTPKTPSHTKGPAHHTESKMGIPKYDTKTPLRLPSNIGRSTVHAIGKGAQTPSSTPEDEKELNTSIPVGEGVKDMVKKMEESSVSAPAFVPAPLPPGMDESSELEWLRIQHKDLSEKLETLRQKRKEDHAKLLEFERCRIQVQSLEEFKTKMCEAHKEVQRKLQEKERMIRELESKQNESEDLTEMEERLELAILDREVAQEKAELLQEALDEQKDKVNELEMELQVLRSEMEQQVVGAEDPNSVIKAKQLEQQNLKLREGIVKLRDAFGQATADKQEALKDAETLKEENATLVKMLETAKQESALAQETIAGLREQVDAVMGSEEMIEKLTERNLGMEEKMHALEEAVEDLEALHAMDEEILETQKETEKDLRMELDTAQCRISQLNRQIKASYDQAEEHDKIVQKFRQKISELNHMTQDYTDQVLLLREQIQEMERGETCSGVPVGFMSANRAFIDEVEKEMKIIELESAIQRASYLEAFLPDNFNKPGGDNDAVILNTLFARLSRKTVGLTKLLDLKYPGVPGGLRREHITKSHKAEQWAHSAKFVYYLSALRAVTHKFESSLQRCSVERLSRLSQMHVEMSSHERALDQYVELLRMDRLDENTGTENLQKAISYFQNVFSVHMAGEWFDRRILFNDILSQIESGLHWSKINIQRFGFFLLPGQEESDVAQFETALLAAITDCHQLILRARNRVPTEGEFPLTQEIDDQLVLAVCSFEKAAAILDRFCSVASTQLSMLPDVEGLEVDRLKEMLLGAIEKTHGKGKESEGNEIVKNHLYNLRSSLVEIANWLDTTELEPFPPLLERAHARKQDAVEAESLRWQVEKKEAEITELRKTIRSKNEDLSNYRLRLEMAQSKIESSDKADEVRLQMLQSRCNGLEVELRKKQTEFDETVDGLQRDLTALEKENADLKERSRHMCKKTLLMNLNNSMAQSTITSAPTTPLGLGGSIASHVAEIEYLESELNDKQQTIKYAESRIRQLKSRITLLEMARLSPVSLPKTICGPLTLSSAKQDRTKETLDKLTKEAETLFMEASRFQVPYVEDFTKPIEKRLVEEHLYHARINEINRRIKDLKVRVQKYFATTYVGEACPVFLTKLSEVVPEKTEPLAEDKVDTIRGIRSDNFKKAYENLFGNLEAEKRAFEERRQTIVAA